MRAVLSFLAVTAIILIAGPAFAEEGGAALSGSINGFGPGLGLGLAALGVGLGQGRATAAAMESIGRNPNSAERLFTPFILGLALMEALALYAFVIAIIKI